MGLTYVAYVRLSAMVALGMVFHIVRSSPTSVMESATHMGFCITGEVEKLHLQSKQKMILGEGLSWKRNADVVVALSSTASNTSTIDADPLSALRGIAGVDTMIVQIGVQSILEQLSTCYDSFLELEAGLNGSVKYSHFIHVDGRHAALFPIDGRAALHDRKALNSTTVIIPPCLASKGGSHGPGPAIVSYKAARDYFQTVDMNTLQLKNVSIIRSMHNISIVGLDDVDGRPRQFGLGSWRMSGCINNPFSKSFDDVLEKCFRQEGFRKHFGHYFCEKSPVHGSHVDYDLLWPQPDENAFTALVNMSSFTGYPGTTNPSIIRLDDRRYFIVARQMLVRHVPYDHRTRKQRSLWANRVVVSSQRDLDMDVVNRTLSNYTVLDIPDDDIAKKRSCGGDVSMGAEDPHVFRAYGQVYLLYNLVSCMKWKRVVTPNLCKLDVSSWPPKCTSPAKIMCPRLYGTTQKNWVPFVGADGVLRMSTNLMPTHKYIIVDENGNCSHPDAAALSGRDLTGHFSRFGIYFGNAFISGGPIAVSVGEGKYFLSIAHVRDTDGVYHHIPYLMSALPPFDVVHVAHELVLHSQIRVPKKNYLVSFVSGIHIEGSKVVISYGSADFFSKIHVTTLHALFPGVFKHFETIQRPR